MGIFTRFRDIVSSNMNAMLDRAEDPEKMVKLMIREMEDTLVEMKASCAGIIAERKKQQRRFDELNNRQTHWEERARLAVDKGRDDLAREALYEKRRFTRMLESIERELTEYNDMVDQHQDDICQLEEKLHQAQEKQRLLVQRHIRARQAKRSREEIRRIDNHQAVVRFDALENRIERMEAEADLVNLGRKTTLDEAFEELTGDDDIERELAVLKSESRKEISE